MTNNVEITPQQDAPEFQLTLPVSSENFGEFLKGLISGKETISSVIGHRVLVDSDLLKSLVEAINYRVINQNKSQLVSAKFDVSFASGRQYSLKDISSIGSISPLAKDSIVLVEINLIYIVQFPKYSYPTRQQINIVLSSSGDKFGRESPNCTIEFAERTWAEDIINLFQSVFTQSRPLSSIDKNIKFRMWFIRNRSWLKPFLSIFTILVYFISLAMIGANSALDLSTNPSSINNQDLAAQLLLYTNPILQTALIALIVMPPILFLSIAEQIFNFDPVSRFEPRIVFDIVPGDKEKNESARLANDRIFFRSIGAFLFSVIASVIAAFTYDYFLKVVLH